MFTLAMPQSEPVTEIKRSASRMSLVKIEDDSPCVHSVMQGDCFIEIAIAQDVEDGREGLVSHDLELFLYLNQSWLYIEGFGTTGYVDAFATMQDCTCRSSCLECRLHSIEGMAIDQRAYECSGILRIADRDRSRTPSRRRGRRQS